MGNVTRPEVVREYGLTRLMCRGLREALAAGDKAITIGGRTANRLIDRKLLTREFDERGFPRYRLTILGRKVAARVPVTLPRGVA